MFRSQIAESASSDFARGSRRWRGRRVQLHLRLIRLARRLIALHRRLGRLQRAGIDLGRDEVLEVGNAERFVGLDLEELAEVFGRELAGPTGIDLALLRHPLGHLQQFGVLLEKLLSLRDVAGVELPLLLHPLHEVEDLVAEGVEIIAASAHSRQRRFELLGGEGLLPDRVRLAVLRAGGGTGEGNGQGQEPGGRHDSAAGVHASPPGGNRLLETGSASETWRPGHMTTL
jgi:hypothetical protein